MTMNYRYSLAALAAFCCLFSNAAGQSTQIALGVYYETLCPDSIHFITRELAPNYQHFKSFLDLDFIPFGKASWVPGNEQQPTQFSCQHGERECYGNKAHACVLHEIERTVSDQAHQQQQQQKKMSAVNCMMGNRNPASLAVVRSCAERVGLSADAIENDCIKASFGDDLLVAQGEKSNSVQKPLTFVPTITVNGEKRGEAFTNFTGLICRLIPDAEKPSICSRY